MYKKIFCLALITIMTAAALAVTLDQVQGEEVNNFNGRGGPTEGIVELTGSGHTLYDPHMYFDIERNVPLSSASMKVSTQNAATGPWIRDPSVDVGIDGNDEWSYSGTGYGDFGRNTHYFDDTQMKTNTYGGASERNLGDVIIPSEAEILDARMSLKGRFEADIPGMERAATAGQISYTPRWTETGDIDGDGYNDSMVSTGDSGDLYKYISDGGISFEKTKISAPSSYDDYLLYDADDDDDLDLVYSNSNGISYLENDGSGNFSSTSSTMTSSFSPEFLTAGDLDGDGEDEIIGAEESWTWSTSETVISYLKRDSGSDFDLWPLYDTGSGSGSSTLYDIKIGDWNDDDYVDIFAAFSNKKVYTYENPAFAWYYDDTSNISSKSDWSQDHVFTSTYSIQGWDVGDVDKDGKADVAIAAYTYSSDIYYYRNQGTSSWSSYRVVSFTINYPRDVSLVDMNGDDYLDVFFVSGSYYYNNRIGWAKNDQTPNQNSWSSYTLMSGQDNTGDTVFKGDVNSDGHIDTGLFFTSNRQIIYWSNSAPHDGSNIEPGFIEDGGLVQLRDMVVRDMNDDGRDDLIITASQSGTVGWYENDGTPFTGEWDFHRINSVIVSGAREVDVGDIDNDGDLDVAVTAYDMGNVMWFENDGDPEGLWKYHYVGNMRYIHGCALGDMDEDGNLDILVSAGYYYSNGIRMYYTSDPTGSWSYRRISPRHSYCGAINITDMNQDGHLDVITTVNGWSGQANIYRNPLPSKNPRNTQWTQIGVVSGLSYPYEALPIDINDDGVLDVVAASNYGGIKWGEAPSNPNSVGGWSTHTLDKSINYPWGLAVDDVDNDGYDDVFVSSHYWWSSSYWSYGKGLFWLEEGDDPYSTWQKRTLDSSLEETYGVQVTDLDGDDEPEIFVASMNEDKVEFNRPELNYPSDIRLDLAGDDVYDYEGTGYLRGDMDIDLTDQFQRVLDTKPSSASFTTDANGNPISQMSMDLYSASLGRLTGYGIDIRYNVTMEVDNNGLLRESLTRIIPDYNDPDQDYISVYINFKGSTEGSALLSDLKLEYNAPPKLSANLPDRLEVEENSLNRNHLDLSRFFRDDYDSPSMLNYEVETVGLHSSKVAVLVENGANLTIDSRIDEDFDGFTHIRINVIDNGGPGDVPPRSIRTKKIQLDVLPVDDHPVKGNDTLPERLTAYEGTETMVIDLSEYNLFYDPDDPQGSNIRYYVEMDPEGTDPRDLTNISFHQPGADGKFTVKAEGDWTGAGIPIKVWGYDLGPQGYLRDPENDPFHMTLLDVVDINDPPFWKMVPEIQAKEDTGGLNVFDLTPFVTDIDDDPNEIEFELLSQTNTSFFRVELDRDDSSQINLEPLLENWNGYVEATIEASDGEYTDRTTITIHVMPVNDLPEINIVSPMEDSSYEEGEISVQGDAFDVEGIERVYIDYFDRTYIANGRNSWGMTIEMPESVDITELTYDVPVTVTVEDTDGATASDTVHITLIPKVVIPDPDRDGDGRLNFIDDFPDNPSEWKDSDRDGVGDNEDQFDENPDWQYDSDKDGIADAADEDPYNPMIPGEGSTGPGSRDIEDEPEEANWTLPVLFFVLAGVLATAAIVSLLAFMVKRSASKDPKKAVDFYRKQEKRRDLFKKMSGREKIEGLLTKTHVSKEDMGRGPAPAPSNIPTPHRGGAPLPPPQAAKGRNLPPAVRGQQAPPPGRAMPPRRPGM